MPIFRIVKLLLIFLLVTKSLYCQKKTGISLGVSLPELLNIKIRYGGDFKVSGGLGYLPVVNVMSFSGDFNYYFPGNKKEDQSLRWFLASGLSYFPPSESNSSSSRKFLLMYTRLGATVCFNKKLNQSGLDFGLGIMNQIWTNEKYSYGPIGMGHPVTKNAFIGPSIGISYFTRL